MTFIARGISVASLLFALGGSASAQVPPSYNVARGVALSAFATLPLAAVTVTAIGSLSSSTITLEQKRRRELTQQAILLSGLAAASPMISGSARAGGRVLQPHVSRLPTAPGKIGLALSAVGTAGLTAAWVRTARDRRSAGLWIASCIVAGAGMALGVGQWGVNEATLARERPFR